MTRYYIVVDTDRQIIGFRKSTRIDEFNDNVFAEYWYGVKENLSRILSDDSWDDISAIMDDIVNRNDDQKSRGVF